MLLRAVVYSKVTEMKLVLYDSDPIMQGWEWNISLFVQWILGMGERESFPDQPWTTNAKFPFKYQCKQSFIKWKFSIVSFSNTPTISIIWFSMFS